MEIPKSDIKLYGSNLEILGESIILDGNLLATTSRTLWLDHDSLLITWDMRKAQLENRDANRPYDPNNLVELEGRLEVSDVILVEFERVDPEPLSDLRREVRDGDPLSLSEDELLGTHRTDEHDVMSGRWDSLRDEADASRRGEGQPSVFDVDPPPTWVRRRLSLIETLETLRETTRTLTSRVFELERRINELENPS